MVSPPLWATRGIGARSPWATFDICLHITKAALDLIAAHQGVTLTYHVNDVTISKASTPHCKASAFAQSSADAVVHYVQAADDIELPLAVDKGFYLGSNQGLLLEATADIRAEWVCKVKSQMSSRGWASIIRHAQGQAP